MVSQGVQATFWRGDCTTGGSTALKKNDTDCDIGWGGFSFPLPSLPPQIPQPIEAENWLYIVQQALKILLSAPLVHASNSPLGVRAAGKMVSLPIYVI